jgi:large subunit ribosomal protein L17
MLTSLFKYDRIRTTDVKAKELRRWADDLITLAKRGDLHARRQALAIVREKTVVHKLFETANERFGQKDSGYTRIVKIGYRPGDAAPVSLIELITTDTVTKKKKAKSKADPKETTEPKAAAEQKAEEKEAAVEAKAETTPVAPEQADDPLDQPADDGVQKKE